MAADIKAAHLRALAAEENARKSSAAARPTVGGNGIPRTTPSPVVPRPDGNSGSRISVANMREERKPVPGVLLKKVVDYLKQQRRDVSVEELKRELQVELDESLRYSLEGNPKVAMTPDGRYRFKVRFSVPKRASFAFADAQPYAHLCLVAQV